MAKEEIVRTNPDPTKNVLDLVKAAIDRLNDLMSAETRRVDEKIQDTKDYVNKVFEEHEIRYGQRFDAQEKFTASSFASTKEAVTKAENSAEKRFESINEFRGTLADQQRNLLPRSEAFVKFDALEKQLDEIKSRLDKMEGKGSGLSQGWSILVGAVGLISIIISIFFRLVVK